MKVYIFTEGFKNTGYGHLTRCLSLYQAFIEKGITPTIFANIDKGGKELLGNIRLDVLDWITNCNIVLKILDPIDIAIIDSYLAPLSLVKNIGFISKKSVYIDDFMRLNYPDGIVINGSVNAKNLTYQLDGEHKYLLGLDYIPLRKEFWDDVPKRYRRSIKNILITFGGQDLKNLTFPLLDYLLGKLNNLNYKVVLGSGFENIDKKNEYRDIRNVSFYENLNAEEMLKLMLISDLAISAAGQTTYELARVGIPTIAIGVAENQRFNLNGWIKLGFIEKDLWYNRKSLFHDILIQLRKKMRERFHCKQYVDGQGAKRIVNFLMEIK